MQVTGSTLIINFDEKSKVKCQGGGIYFDEDEASNVTLGSEPLKRAS